MSAVTSSDNTRKWGQLIISFILVGLMVGYLVWYTAFSGDDTFTQQLAENFQVLIIMGIGAALAVFGLGRTVGKK